MSCMAGIPGIDTFYGWDYTSDLRWYIDLYQQPQITGGAYTGLGYANTEQEANFTLPMTAAGPGYLGNPGDNSIQRINLRPERWFHIKPRIFIADSLEPQFRREIYLTVTVEDTEEVFEAPYAAAIDARIPFEWCHLLINAVSEPPNIGKKVTVRCSIGVFDTDTYDLEHPEFKTPLSYTPIGFPFTVTCTFE